MPIGKLMHYKFSYKQASKIFCMFEKILQSKTQIIFAECLFAILVLLCQEEEMICVFSSIELIRMLSVYTS